MFFEWLLQPVDLHRNYKFNIIELLSLDVLACTSVEYDKKVDEYTKSVNKDVSTYYENKERIAIMQTLMWFIDNLQEIIEERN